MNLRRTIFAAAALAVIAAPLAACSPDEDGGATAGSGSSSSAPAQGGAQGQSDGGGADSGGQTSSSGYPRVGEGDPMLGATDGQDRPALADIQTGDLDQTNALEQAEKFRRYAVDAGADDATWLSQVQSVSDPSFAASLAVSDHSILRGAAVQTLTVSDAYSMVSSSAPYASIEGKGADGAAIWTIRLSFSATKADPSIGTWKVVSIDWTADMGNAMVPFTEESRASTLTSAATASAPIFAQEPGDTAETRAERAGRFFTAPAAVAQVPMPFPDQNTTAVAGDPTGRYFVTPDGSADIWVEINNTSQISSPSGDFEGDPKQSVVYVKMSYDGEGNWLAADAQTGAP